MKVQYGGKHHCCYATVFSYINTWHIISWLVKTENVKFYHEKRKCDICTYHKSYKDCVCIYIHNFYLPNVNYVWREILCIDVIIQVCVNFISDWKDFKFQYSKLVLLLQRALTAHLPRPVPQCLGFSRNSNAV